MAPVLKAQIGSNKPVSGWTSLALSCGGIVASVSAPISLWVGINQPSFSTGLHIGLGGLALAPFFSIAGWIIGDRGNRLNSPDTGGHEVGGRVRTDSAPLGRAISWVRAGPSLGKWMLDGPSLGKAGLIIWALLALAALGALWWFLWQFNINMSNAGYL